jgi:hypothetical protein
VIRAFNGGGRGSTNKSEAADELRRRGRDLRFLGSILVPADETVPEEVVLWDADDADEVVALYRDLCEEAPRELTLAVNRRRELAARRDRGERPER